MQRVSVFYWYTYDSNAHYYLSSGSHEFYGRNLLFVLYTLCYALLYYGRLCVVSGDDLTSIYAEHVIPCLLYDTRFEARRAALATERGDILMQMA